MLMTDRYKRSQRRLHKNPRYGAASKKFAPLVAEVIERCKPASILDYGAGKCALRAALGAQIEGLVFKEYDPALGKLARMPGGEFDLVCCIDVLEHIEPACLGEVLASIKSKTGQVAFMTIHTGPAGKYLDDGRNAHLIQKPTEWWRDVLTKFFGDVQMTTHDVTLIVEAR
jgi:2-polyprenyl-3-methyl-5-hydroxy-6-metoxy-1,4-benzoquinol methylase